MRVQTAIELALNKNRYAKVSHFPHAQGLFKPQVQKCPKLKDKKDAIDAIMLTTIIPGEWCGIWELCVGSSVLRLTLCSVFPDIDKTVQGMIDVANSHHVWHEIRILSTYWKTLDTEIISRELRACGS